MHSLMKLLGRSTQAILVFTLVFGLSALAAQDADDADGQLGATASDQTRSTMPIQELIEQVEQEHNAQIIEMELDRATGDVYQVILRHDGDAQSRIVVDAYTGETVAGSGRRGDPAGAGSAGPTPIQDVITRIEQAYNGRVTEIELEHEDTHDEYEIELVDADGVIWEIDVDARTGELLKQERDGRVSSGSPFAVLEGLLPMQEVIKQVESEHGGRVVEIELERESFHDAYEIELIDATDQKWKIEVDAHSGEMINRKRD